MVHKLNKNGLGSRLRISGHASPEYRLDIQYESYRMSHVTFTSGKLCFVQYRSSYWSPEIRAGPSKSKQRIWNRLSGGTLISRIVFINSKVHIFTTYSSFWTSQGVITCITWSKKRPFQNVHIRIFDKFWIQNFTIKWVNFSSFFRMIYL